MLRSDHLIEKRRNQEKSLVKIYDFIKKDTNLLQKAVWDNKSALISEKQQNKRQYDQFQYQRKQFLDVRRKKLSELLEFEEELYRKEIIAKQETPEQVRKKMEARLIDLKTARENERKELVRKLQEKRFYESADELRKNDSEAFAIACYLEQENQMLDKLKRRDQERMEEEIYVKMNNYDIIKKSEKEKIQIEEKKKLKDDTYKFLEWQKIQHNEAISKENELKDLEAIRLKEQWEKDLLQEKIEKEKAFEMNKAVYRDIEEFNRKEEIERQRKILIDKHKDKEMINHILEKEKAMDEIDRKEREKKINEFHQNKKYLEYIMNQKKEAEAWMDKLAQIEADKQWAKTQDVWIKEEAAKIELLKHVYKEREEALKYKKNVKEQEHLNLLKDRNDLDESIRRYNEQLEKIKQEDLQKRKSHQEDLRYQMMDKQRLKQKEFQDKLYDERAAKLWELEYQKKINEQREIHFKKLREIKEK